MLRSDLILGRSPLLRTWQLGYQMHQAFPRTRLTPPHSIIHAVASSVPSNYFQSRGAGPRKQDKPNLGSGIRVRGFLLSLFVFPLLRFSSFSYASLIVTGETWRREWREAYENERGTRWTYTNVHGGGCKELDKVTMSARKGLPWVTAYLETLNTGVSSDRCNFANGRTDALLRSVLIAIH